ncbi:hypothetical protein FPV67DRAFT_1424328 [Lyophyllum atratum]|nr:hypothetical protein FPV67DRAFT_1424328 [Lyophyllum atratum]
MNGVASAEGDASATAHGQPKEEGETAVGGENAGGEDKGASIRSAETAQTQASTAAAWYTPWAWYAAPAPVHPAGTSASGAVDPGSESGDGNGDEVAGEGRGAMSPADRVKEAALAREEEEEAKVVEGKVEAAEEKASPADVNPVAETMSTNRSGWVSFFSSASLMRKTITDEQADAGKTDENGMEVMDVPEVGDTGAEEQMRGRDAGKAKAVGGDAKDGGMRGGSPVSVNNGTKPPAPPLTISENVKRETVKSNLANKKKDLKVGKKSASPSPSSKSAPAAPRTPVPNLILPTWADTFHTAPRSVLPPQPTSKFSKTMKFVSGVLFPTDKPETAASPGRSKGKGREQEFAHFGKELPRAWDVLQERLDPDVLRGCRRVIVIGIHGWFPGAVMRTVLGEPTGTSAKFVSMMVQALEEFQEQHGVKFEKITTVPLEGEGTIEGRVAKLYANLQANQEWMDDLHGADAVLIATHSQGSIVSTHLLDRLIRDRHIRTSQNTVIEGASELLPVTGLATPALQPQRVCCLALCGIHLGPLRYLSSSSLLQPYFHYFESAAARELFEFQNTESEVSKNYVKVLSSVVSHGVKMVYVASLNDQVVPIYSGLFTAVSHPLILRALYIDGDAYHSSDFLSNLLVLLLRVLNSGISDSGLTVHLSEATAGSLSGVGHSTAYEELSTYSLAVKYLFLTNNGLEDRHTDLVLEPFNATTEQNDYEIPWALRDVIADERVEYFFSREIAELRDAFRDWHPKTTVLRDLKRKLQPIQRLPSSFFSPSASKL